MSVQRNMVDSIEICPRVFLRIHGNHDRVRELTLDIAGKHLQARRAFHSCYTIRTCASSRCTASGYWGDQRVGRLFRPLRPPSYTSHSGFGVVDRSSGELEEEKRIVCHGMFGLCRLCCVRVELGWDLGSFVCWTTWLHLQGGGAVVDWFDVTVCSRIVAPSSPLWPFRCLEMPSSWGRNGITTDVVVLWPTLG
jgi:hypothetical protein